MFHNAGTSILLKVHLIPGKPEFSLDRLKDGSIITDIYRYNVKLQDCHGNVVSGKMTPRLKDVLKLKLCTFLLEFYLCQLALAM